MGVGVGGIGAKDFAKFLFGEVKIILCDVEIAKVYFCFGGPGIEFQRVLEGVRGILKIFLAGVDDAEEVVTLDARGILR